MVENNTISRVNTEGLGSVALARRFVPSSRGLRSNWLSLMAKPLKLFRAVMGVVSDFQS